MPILSTEEKKKLEKLPAIDVKEVIKTLEKKGFPQPIRAQPRQDIMHAKDLFEYLSKITAESVQKWGRDTIIADTKYAGIRGLIIIMPKRRQVWIFSRKMNRLYNFEDKFGQRILEDLADNLEKKGPTILDSELFAVTKDGKPIPQPIATGFGKAPQNYPDLVPNVRVFDILAIGGKDVRSLPLEERKKLILASLDHEGGVLFPAESKKVKPTPKRLERLLREVMREKQEGLVLKDPQSRYFYGKIQDEIKNPWRKFKIADTLDLRLLEVSAYPEGKDAWFLKHWRVAPENAPDHLIEVDKGIRAAKLNHEFYAKFTKEILDMIKRGDAKPVGPLVPVDRDKVVMIDGKRVKLIDYYGTDKIPSSVKLKKKVAPIVEVFAEQITPDLKISGGKIVGIRTDKKKADTLGTLKKFYRLFYSVPPSQRDARFLVTSVANSKMSAQNKLVALLMSKRPDITMRVAYEYGLLSKLSPKLAELKQVYQKSVFHPELTVFGHTLSALKYTTKYEDILDEDEMKTLRLALLFHDIGKQNEIKKYDRSGRVWFPGHAELSARLAEQELKRLGFPKKEIADIVWLIKNHMIFNRYLRMSEKEKKQLMKHRLFPLLVAHFLADGLNILNKQETIQQMKKEYPKLTPQYNDKVMKLLATVK